MESWEDDWCELKLNGAIYKADCVKYFGEKHKYFFIYV